MAKVTKSNKIWWIAGGLVAALVLFLVVGKQQGWIGKEKPTEVDFAKAMRTDITETVSASGKVQPEVEVKISPDVSGEIIGLYISEGDSVVKGQLLLKIRPDNYESFYDRGKAAVNQTKAGTEQARASFAQSEAQLLRAKVEFNRQQKLFNDKVISQADFELAETNFKVAQQQVEASKANVQAGVYSERSAEAALKDAAENLRKTAIYAPQSGIISKLAVELGERVVGTSQMAGTELLRIANLNNMEVRVNVNENDIVRVSLGDTAVIDVDAYTASNKKFKGVVYEIASTANGSGSSLAAAASTDAVTEFEVKIRVLRSSYYELIDAKHKKKYPFKPGMTATVDVVTAKKLGVLTIPIAAVTTRSKDENAKEDDKKEDEKKTQEDTKKKEAPKEVVFVHEKDKAVQREVKTGITDTSNGNIEILSGLKENDEIIAGPFIVVSKKLKDGALITKRVAKAKKEEKAEE